MRKDGGTWTGFLVMAFAVVGLIGMLATFAAQVPLERALSREAALDAAETALRAGDRASAERLRPELGDSARLLDQPPGAAAPDAFRAERARVRQAFRAEAADIGLRLRIVIAVFAAAGALFGAALLSVVRREAR